MAGAAPTYGEAATGLSARIQQAMIWLRAVDRRILLLNLGFAVALIAGLAIVAYVAFRPAPLPTAQTKAGVNPAPIINGQQEPVPVVEPTILMPTDMDSARKINAAVPFSKAPNPAATPFNSLETPDNLQRSVDCLATAILYEAGDDNEGERAVAQVILNRVRHPAFPNSVCGVVFQGSERTTGCQFTFTCDGSLQRRVPKPAAWVRAQEIARQALTGSVYAPVGTATHYHTDWVVPYWSSSLDKITAVKTHLFFRWKGWWGTPPAFRQIASVDAPIIPQLASVSDVHKTPEQLNQMRMMAALETMAIRREGNVFLIGWDKATALEILPQLASTLCGPNPDCRVVGWPGGEAALPKGDGTAAVMRASFLYHGSATLTGGRAMWNCKSIKLAGAQCLSTRDLQAVKLDPITDVNFLASNLPPMPTLADALPEVSTPASALETVVAASATPAAAAAPAAAPIPRTTFVAPTPKRRDPCAAMRMVAEADRVGPCARRD